MLRTKHTVDERVDDAADEATDEALNADVAADVAENFAGGGDTVDDVAEVEDLIGGAGVTRGSAAVRDGLAGS